MLAGTAVAVASGRAAADPPILGDVISVGTAYGPAVKSQESPSCVFDGARYFVVWQDQRGGNFDIYGTFVDEAGNILVPEAILIASAAYDQINPDVAWDGSNFLVVWEDRRTLANLSDVYAARVSPSGEVLDPGGIPVSAIPNNQIKPRVAAGGGMFFVAWADDRGSSSHIYGARISPGGAVGDPDGIGISTTIITIVEDNPDVAWNGTNFLVVWEDMRLGTHIYGARVSTAGTVLDTNHKRISDAPNIGEQRLPRVASADARWLVVWSDYRYDAAGDIYGSRVDSNGTVLDGGGIPIATAAGVRNFQPDISARAGSGYFIAWEDNRNGNSDVYAAITNLNGFVTTSDIAACTQGSTQNRVAAGSGSTTFLALWRDARNFAVSDRDIYGNIISNAGVPASSDGMPIGVGANDQGKTYDAAFDGTNWMVCWADNRSDHYNIYAARVSAAGAILDSPPITVCSAAGHQRNPRIAFDGTNYFVVWEDRRNGLTGYDIYGARVSPGGTVLNANGFLLSRESDPDNPGQYREASEDQTNPDVAWNGVHYLVVWSDQRNTFMDPVTDVFATRVTPTGTVPVEPANKGITDSLNVEPPRVASDGSGWVMVWGQNGDIWKSRMAANGTLAAPTQLAAATGEQSAPDIAWSNGNYLAVWQDRGAGFFFDIVGSRLDGAGNRIDATDVIIRNGPDNERNPSVVKLGNKWYVMYEDFRASGGSTLGDIYYSELSEDMVNTDPAGFAVRTNSAPNEYPVLVAGPSTIMLALWSDLVSGANLLFGRTVNTADSVPVDTISNAKKDFADGTKISLSGKTVTASTADMGAGVFYMQDVLWTGGIRVITAESVARGDIVDVVGTLQTNANGEREIDASAVPVTGNHAPPEPIHLRNLPLGGSDFYYDPGPPKKGQRGVFPGGKGVNNIGLLTRLEGTVTFKGSDHFYIWDGSYISASQPLDDGSGHLGIKVASGSLTAPEQGEYAVVTGISSVEESGSVLIRVLRPRAQADIAQ